MSPDQLPQAPDLQAGYGSDKSPLDRPGIPQEASPPQPLASAHWITPEQQQSEMIPLVGKGMKLTPVFSTAVPTRGLSGALRHLAYRIPDYRARRWLLLMLADRVDVIEHRPQVLLPPLLGVAALSAAVVGLRRWRARA